MFWRDLSNDWDPSCFDFLSGDSDFDFDLVECSDLDDFDSDLDDFSRDSDLEPDCELSRDFDEWSNRDLSLDSRDDSLLSIFLYKFWSYNPKVFAFFLKYSF